MKTEHPKGFQRISSLLRKFLAEYRQTIPRSFIGKWRTGADARKIASRKIVRLGDQFDSLHGLNPPCYACLVALTASHFGVPAATRSSSVARYGRFRGSSRYRV